METQGQPWANGVASQNTHQVVPPHRGTVKSLTYHKSAGFAPHANIARRLSYEKSGRCSHPLQLALARLSAQTILTEEEAAALLALPGSSQEVRPGAALIKTGLGAASSCLLFEGIVARTLEGADGSRQITAFYFPGDLPDLQSLVQPIATSSLRALTQCKILRIGHSALREVAAQFPGLQEAFWRYTVLDAAVATEWVANVGNRSGPQRVAHLLCEIAVRTGQPSDYQFCFNQPLTQNVLGEATGLSAVHINRSLQYLRRKNLIQTEKNIVTVPNWKQLTEVADFDDAYLKAETPLRLS